MACEPVFQTLCDVFRKWLERDDHRKAVLYCRIATGSEKAITMLVACAHT